MRLPANGLRPTRRRELISRTPQPDTALDVQRDQDRVGDYEALNVARNAPHWLKMLHKHGYIAAPAAA